jgi:hypothetical protein
MSRPAQDPVARFWPKVARSDGGCWLWTAAADPLGYGRFGVSRGDIRLAHRYSMELAGHDVANAIVCHRCDNPRCVNPAHLYLGTYSDNLRDRYARRPGNVPRGERHCWAKLSDEIVRTIFRMRAEGRTHRVIAESFGVPECRISVILARKSWAHVAL